MFSRSVSLLALVLAASAVAACTAPNDADQPASSDEALTSGPGAHATDARTPELGSDLTVVRRSRISMADAVKKVATANGPVIEAKFELDHSGALSLSVYPVPNGLAMDSERNVFQELAGDPTVAPFSGGVETFGDDEHVLRSSRDLTLVQLSRLSLGDAVAKAGVMGQVFWAIPTIRDHRAGYGVYALSADGRQAYRFIDGHGSDESTTHCGLEEIGATPGAAATDARHPELGEDLTVVRHSRLSMSAALAKSEATNGPAIEAKFEIGDDGNLALSIYPVGKGVEVDAERNTFFEVAGDPTAAAFAPSKSEFSMPDFEHVARSARDLTLVQTASLSLREAVAAVDRTVPGGFVYWAIPTIRGTRSGYGIYTLGTDNRPHYFFVS